MKLCQFSQLTSVYLPQSAPSSTLYTPTLGFASNLSHSIIKETQEDETRSHRSADSVSTSVSISDEELALLGAPWAKEGMLCRKQYWETAKRKAKTRNWMDVFVVISKGEFSMFTFGEHGPSPAVSTVGGGNWLVSVFPTLFAVATDLPLYVEQRESGRRILFGAFSCPRPSISWLQSTTPLLLRPHTVQRRSLLLPGWNGRAYLGVGVDVQLLGSSTVSRTSVWRSF